MKMWIALLLAAFAASASAQSCSCDTMKWATCDGNPCQCTLLIGSNLKQALDCTTSATTAAAKQGATRRDSY